MDREKYSEADLAEIEEYRRRFRYPLGEPKTNKPYASDNRGKTGTWKCLGHVMGFCKHPLSIDWKCSECGFETNTLMVFPPDVCPQCGAKLEVEQREVDDGKAD